MNIAGFPGSVGGRVLVFVVVFHRKDQSWCVCCRDVVLPSSIWSASKLFYHAVRDIEQGYQKPKKARHAENNEMFGTVRSNPFHWTGIRRSWTEYGRLGRRYLRWTFDWMVGRLQMADGRRSRTQ